MYASVRLIPALTVTLALLVSPSDLPAAQDPLAAAKAAYVATDYEEALKILAASNSASDAADVYKALCLLALGRMSEVDTVLRTIVVRNPSYRMSERDVTPRMIALFEDVRTRTLEAMVKEAYASAKSSFDARRFSEASDRFGQVLSLVAGENGAFDGEGSPARDVAQLARGFKELADAEVAKSAAAAAALPPGAATPPATTAPATPASAIARDEVIISGVVERYALAFSALDASAVVKVYPTEDADSLRSAFGRLKSQNIQARDVDIALDPDGRSATVRLLWVVQAAPKVGSAIKTQRPTTLRLSRTDAGDWAIVSRQ